MANCIPFHSYMIGTGKNGELLQKSKSKLLKEYQTIGNEPYEKNFDCR
jgi:hypothetical protein